jgi:hypothetical protein
VMGLWLPFSHAQTPVVSDANTPTLATVAINARRCLCRGPV